MAQFEMVGKLAIAKDGEKRKAFDELRYKKGSIKKDGTKRTDDFTMRTLRLNMETAEDFFNVRIQGNLMGNEDTAKVYSLVKNSEGKHEPIEFKYKDREDVKKCLDKAVEFLSKSQTSTGGFTEGINESVESNAQVLIALNALGISVNDSRFIKNNQGLVQAHKFAGHCGIKVKNKLSS